MSRIEPMTYTSATAMLANYQAIHARLLGSVPEPEPIAAKPVAPRPERPPPAEPEKSLRSILCEVAKFHGWSEADLLGPRRWPHLVYVRWVFFYRALSETRLSSQQIGQFCGKDHTTVLHGARVYCRQEGLADPRGEQE